MAGRRTPTGGSSSRRSSPASGGSSRRHSPAWDVRTGGRPMISDQFVREARDGGAGGGRVSRPARPPSSGTPSAAASRSGSPRDFGDELSARGDGRSAVLRAAESAQPVAAPRPTRERSVQHSLAAIVARFRLAPPQACDNLFILDFIARRSARRGRRRRGQAAAGRCASIRISGRSSPASTRPTGQGQLARRWRSSAARSRSSSIPTTPPI